MSLLAVNPSCGFLNPKSQGRLSAKQDTSLSVISTIRPVNTPADFSFIPEKNNRQLTLRLSGCWRSSCPVPELDRILHQIPDDIQALRITVDPTLVWDSILAVFLNRLLTYCHNNSIATDLSDLPAGVRTLLALAQKSSHKPPAETDRPGFVYRLGKATQKIFAHGEKLVSFTGEIVLALILLIRGKTYFRFRDFFYFIQNCGADALPIVSLISVLVGVILAFVGAVQLRIFGAQIYVANLVALSMVLEMGAMMSAVIMAGRTGASFAAQLGTMQVNEEIDALRTLGISPVSYLVLPRMLALICMMPLLCIYADLLGIAGGTIIGIGMLDFSFSEYIVQTKNAIHLNQIAQGIIKSAVYGVLISFSGCFQGMNSGRSASAVGEATTSAVVLSIVLIVVSDAIMTVIFSL